MKKVQLEQYLQAIHSCPDEFILKKGKKEMVKSYSELKSKLDKEPQTHKLTSLHGVQDHFRIYLDLPLSKLEKYLGNNSSYSLDGKKEELWRYSNTFMKGLFDFPCQDGMFMDDVSPAHKRICKVGDYLRYQFIPGDASLAVSSQNNSKNFYVEDKVPYRIFIQVGPGRQESNKQVSFQKGISLAIEDIGNWVLKEGIRACFTNPSYPILGEKGTLVLNSPRNKKK